MGLPGKQLLFCSLQVLAQAVAGSRSISLSTRVGCGHGAQLRQDVPPVPLPRPAPAALSLFAPVLSTAHEPWYPAMLCGSLGPRPGKAGAKYGNECPKIPLPHGGTCHGLTEGDGCAFPWLPRGAIPSRQKKRLRAARGCRGYFILCFGLYKNNLQK